MDEVWELVREGVKLRGGRPVVVGTLLEGVGLLDGEPESVGFQLGPECGRGGIDLRGDTTTLS